MRCLGQKSGALMSGISASIEETQGSPLALPPCGDTERRQPFTNQEGGPHRIPTLCLGLDSPTSRAVRSTFLFVSHPGCRALLQQPEWPERTGAQEHEEFNGLRPLFIWLSFWGYLTWAKYYVNMFHPHKNPMESILLLLCYKWGNRGTEQLNNLPKFTH